MDFDVISFAMGATSVGGATSYDALSDKPKINGVELSGNRAVGDFLTDITDSVIQAAVNAAYDAESDTGGDST